MGTIDWNEKLILNQCGPCSRRGDATLCCAAPGELLLAAQLSGRLWRPGRTWWVAATAKTPEAPQHPQPQPWPTLFQIPEAGCKDQRPVGGEPHFSVLRQPGVANRKARLEFSLRLPGPLTDMSVLRGVGSWSPTARIVCCRRKHKATCFKV